MPIILATQEAEIKRIAVRSQPGQIVPQDPISKNPSQKIGLKVKALSSSPSSVRKKKKKEAHWQITSPSGKVARHQFEICLMYRK
jgi:hypothetical protein